MAALSRYRRPRLRPLLRVFDRILRFLAIVVIVGIVGYGIFALYDRFVRRYNVTIAAGSATGESFLIARALERSLEQRLPNVDVVVRETDGTEANLNLLETGEAQLAAAQADIINDFSDRIQTSQARSVAALYEDSFQLLVCDPTISDFPSFLERLRDPVTPEAVYVPLLGGQRLSFLHLVEHFGLREDEHYFFSGEGAQPGPCTSEASDQIIFRVRVAGNQEVAGYLEAGWRLIPIEQVAAMRLKNSALRPLAIPAGAYAGAAPGDGLVPVPPQDIDTIGVQRLLLARADVPNWLVYEVAAILNASGQELADGLLAYGFEITSTDPGGPYRAYIEEYVVPLAANIAAQNSGAGSIGAPLHPGAYRFYRPNESWFTWLNDNADGLGLAITAATIGGSLGLALNRAIRQARKDTVDGYIKETTYLKRLSGTTPGADDELAAIEQRLAQKRQSYLGRLKSFKLDQLPPDDDMLERGLIEELIDLVSREARLAEVFDEASKALEQDRISEESFRTFTEAYKRTRESVEQRNEELRRAISLFYVDQTMKLIDVERERIATQENLDFIRAEAARVLTDELVFSRESFRTYLDAYTLAKETVAGQRLR